MVPQYAGPILSDDKVGGGIVQLAIRGNTGFVGRAFGASHKVPLSSGQEAHLTCAPNNVLLAWVHKVPWQVCDVGSSHPGAVGGPKGGGVHPLKRRVSWVQTVVRQVGLYPVGAHEG